MISKDCRTTPHVMGHGPHNSSRLLYKVVLLWFWCTFYVGSIPSLKSWSSSPMESLSAPPWTLPASGISCDLESSAFSSHGAFVVNHHGVTCLDLIEAGI